MEYLFYISATLLAYMFVGYPILVWALSHIIKKPVRKSPLAAPVTMVISAYNEEAIIEEKIKNTLALRYPRELLSVLVVSDGSTDRTDDIVRQYASQGVRLIRVEGRVGKTACINAALGHLSGDIVIFSDANSMYDPEAVSHLVANFSDPSVGAVCGELRYKQRSGTEERLYWNLETWIKQRESAVSSCVGVSGSIHAVRRNLLQILPDHVQSDFVQSFVVIRQGYRTVYDSTAFCTEVPASPQGEYARKRRIVHGALCSLGFLREFLNPIRHGWYSIFVWSHKVIRWFMFVPLAGLVVSSAVLAHHPVFLGIFLAQVALYVCAFIGRYARNRVFSIPYYFVLINGASVAAVGKAALGHRTRTWEPVRE